MEDGLWKKAGSFFSIFEVMRKVQGGIIVVLGVGLSCRKEKSYTGTPMFWRNNFFFVLEKGARLGRL